jgi:hypothetical protein
MKRLTKRSLVMCAALVLPSAALTFASSGIAHAYGKADAPVAQVEISGNCNNPSYSLCAPEPDGVGTGGVWAWSELDTDTGSGTAADPSPMDATFAGCSHVVGGVGGPGGAGAGGGPDPFGVWWKVTSLADSSIPAEAFPFFDTSKSYPAYYVMDFFPGSGSDDFVAIVPAQVGHYSLHPAAGVTLQTQVAP